MSESEVKLKTKYNLKWNLGLVLFVVSLFPPNLTSETALESSSYKYILRHNSSSLYKFTLIIFCLWLSSTFTY